MSWHGATSSRAELSSWPNRWSSVLIQWSFSCVNLHFLIMPNKHFSCQNLPSALVSPYVVAVSEWTVALAQVSSKRCLQPQYKGLRLRVALTVLEFIQIVLLSLPSLYIHPFIYPSVHPSIHSFAIHPFIYLSIYLVIYYFLIAGDSLGT